VSLPVLESLQSWLDTAGLLTGYQSRFNLWTDAEEGGGGDFVLFRFAGPGTGNRIEQRYDINIYLIAEPANYIQAQNRINAIRAHLASVQSPPDVVRYAVPGMPTGPFEMANGRKVFELAVFAYQSGDL
jgi:hypothetical protein